MRTVTLAEIMEALDAKLVVGSRPDETRIDMACGADLMSDVLAYAKTGALLLTGLTNEQVVRTAEMADVAAICFVRGKVPGSATVDLASEHGVPLLMTELPMFESCGRLYRHGLKGCSENGD